MDFLQVSAQNQGKCVLILQQHTEGPDRRNDFPALKVIGSGASDFFLGMERSFCQGWLDMNPCLPSLWVLGRGCLFSLGALVCGGKGSGLKFQHCYLLACDLGDIASLL